jgi:hypothetical protein
MMRSREGAVIRQGENYFCLHGRWCVGQTIHASGNHMHARSCLPLIKGSRIPLRHSNVCDPVLINQLVASNLKVQ